MSHLLTAAYWKAYFSFPLSATAQDSVNWITIPWAVVHVGHEDFSNAFIKIFLATKAPAAAGTQLATLEPIASALADLQAAIDPLTFPHQDNHFFRPATARVLPRPAALGGIRALVYLGTAPIFGLLTDSKFGRINTYMLATALKTVALGLLAKAAYQETFDYDTLQLPFLLLGVSMFGLASGASIPFIVLIGDLVSAQNIETQYDKIAFWHFLADQYFPLLAAPVVGAMGESWGLIFALLALIGPLYSLALLPFRDVPRVIKTTNEIPMSTDPTPCFLRPSTYGFFFGATFTLAGVAYGAIAAGTYIGGHNDLGALNTSLVKTVFYTLSAVALAPPIVRAGGRVGSLTCMYYGTISWLAANLVVYLLPLFERDSAMARLYLPMVQTSLVALAFGYAFPRALNWTCENYFVSNTQGSIVALGSMAVGVGAGFLPKIFPFVTTLNPTHAGGFSASLTALPATICGLLSVGLCYWLLVQRSGDGKSLV